VPRPELRNVIVFTIGAARCAVELRWVREVVSLGFVTTVPTAPPALGGVCNLHGTILAVLDLGGLESGIAGPPPRQGDSALVLETDGIVCALRIDQVDHVTSLHTDEAGAAIVDPTGRSLTLIDPERLLKRAIELVASAAG
jgi:chemotaxis signal transduction protein